MSGEPLTRRERRERQAILIETEGREMPSPCTACREAKSSVGRPRPRCVVDVRFGCCSQCVRKGYSSCDVSVTWTEWERLRSQRRKLKRQLDEAEDREEKEISKEFVALQKLPSEGAGALEAPAECLLIPEGTAEELEGVFQLPIPSWADFSLVQDDAFWNFLPDQVSNDGGGIVSEGPGNS